MSLEDFLESQRINGGPHGFEPLGRETLQRLWDAAGREAVREREFVHAESSRIYEKLACMVRAGASGLQLSLALKEAVLSRSKS